MTEKNANEENTQDNRIDEKNPIEAVSIQPGVNKDIKGDNSTLEQDTDASDTEDRDTEDKLRDGNPSQEQKIDIKDGQIKNQFNANEIRNLVIHATEKEHAEDFKDPSDPFFVDERNILDIDSQVLEQCCREIKGERILFVNSFDVDVLSAFPSTLLKKSQLEVSEKRIVLFKGKNLEREDLNINTLVNGQIGDKQPSLIIIEVFETSDTGAHIGAKYLLDSLFQIDTANYKNIINNNLKSKKRMLLFLVEQKLFSKTFEERAKKFMFPTKKVDFLPHLLKRYNYSVEEITCIRDEIEQQRKENLWGRDDSEFYDEVVKYLREHNLSEQVEDRKDKNSFLEKARSVDPGAIFKDDELIKNAIIYTAVCFPGISHYEFEKIVYLLLGMKKGFVFEKVIKKNEEGEKELVEIPMEVLHRETYRKQADKFRAECCLEVARNNDSTHTVVFSTTYLKNDMKAYLEKKYFSFMAEQFRIIQDSGIFFDPQASPELLENIINLFIEMSISNPDRYAKDWLFRIVSALRQEINVDVDSNNNDENELLEQILIQLVEKEQISRLVFDRLANLLREMLSQIRLKEMVENFLEQLISLGQHAITLRLVLELTQRLRFAPHFDQLHWIKQLINRGNEETRKRAYDALRREAKQNNLRIYDFLDEIKTWLPEHDRPIDRYSMSNGYALQFLIDYSYFTITNLDRDHYGLWPSKYPLFANLDEKSVTEKMGVLIDWLFHPGMRYIENEELEINVSLLIGNIFANWFFILKGPNKDFADTEAQKLFDILMAKILEVANPTQKRKIIEAWRHEIETILKRISDSNDLDITQKRELNNRRNFIRFLVKRFKEIQDKKASKEN